MPVKDRLILGATALLCALMLVRSLARAAEVPPVHNWDMTCYVALAIAYEESEPEAIHRRTYETLQAELPPAVYRGLVTGGVKQKRFEDPAALYEHMAFYRARVLYTYPLHLLNKLFGVPLPQGTYWISRGSWIALAILLCVWASRAVGPLAGMPVGTLLAHAPWFIAHMGFSSPDLEATVLTCLGIFLLVECKKDLAGAILLAATIAVRPDTVILALLLAAGLWLFDRGSRPSARFLAIWAGSCLAAYVAVSKYAGAYGWWPLFWISFIKKEEFPARIDTSPDWGLYFRVVRDQWRAIPWQGYYTLQRGVTGSTVPLAFFGAMAAALALLRRSARPELSRYTALFLAFAATYLARWLLFPQLWDRFFAVLYACVPLACLSIAAGFLAKEPSAAPAGPPEPSGSSEDDCNRP